MKQVSLTPAQHLLMIGKRLHAARTARKIPEDVAAKAFKISVVRLLAIERGEKNFSLWLLVKMCQYYKIDVMDVVD